MEIDLSKLKNDFNDFEIEIPMMLEEDFPALLASSNSCKNVIVSFELKTVDILENFFLDVISGAETINISLDRLKRIILAYIGEAVIHHGGGRWEFCDDSKHPGFGTPIVKGYKYDEDGRGMIPVGVRDRLFEEKKGGIIRVAIEACAYKDVQQKKLLDELRSLRKKK